MKVQTNITETVEQVQVIKEIKKKKATITLEVDQDFVDLINFLGEISPSQVKEIVKNENTNLAITKLWYAIRSSEELKSVLGRDYDNNFVLLNLQEQ